MNDERLETLLRAAGESAVPPLELAPGLAERVRRMQRQRKSRNRTLAGGTAAVLVLLAVGVLIQKDVGGDKRSAVPPEGAPDRGGTALALSHPTGSEVEAIKAEIARLDAEARQRQDAVRRLILADAGRVALARVQPDSDAPSPLELVRIEREKTAFLLVDRAEEIGARANDGAAAEYRRVVALFPNTQAAHVAKERLKTL